MANGDTSGLEDFEVEMVNKFTDRFPNGYIMNVDWDNANDFNRLPAFGETNPDALTNRGEPNEQREQSGVYSGSAESRGRKSKAQPAYCATKTFPVTFYDPILRETNGQEMEREQKQEVAQAAQEEIKEQQKAQQEMVAKRGFGR